MIQSGSSKRTYFIVEAFVQIVTVFEVSLADLRLICSTVS